MKNSFFNNSVSKFLLIIYASVIENIMANKNTLMVSACLVPSKEHLSLDLGIMSLNPTLGIKIA